MGRGVQGGDLVGHQRQQRRHDQAHTGPDQGGDLIAQRLAAAGRHQHEGIGARDDVVDDARLRPAKGVIAVNIFENIERGRHYLGRPAIVRFQTGWGGVCGAAAALIDTY